MSLFKAVNNKRKGQTFVEFVVILPILLAIIMAIIEFGWVFYGWITITSSAREGARVYAVTKDESDAFEAVKTASTGFGEDDISVSFELEDGETGDEEKYAYITVSGKFDTILGLFLDDVISIKGRAVMKYE